MAIKKINWPFPFIYILSLTSVILQQQSWIITIETMWPNVENNFNWPLEKTFADWMQIKTWAVRSKVVKERWGAMKSWTGSRAWGISEWISRENMRTNAFNPSSLKIHCSFFFIYVILSSSHGGFKDCKVPLPCKTTSD